MSDRLTPHEKRQAELYEERMGREARERQERAERAERAEKQRLAPRQRGRT